MEMNDANARALVTFLAVGMRVLSARLVLIVALFMSFGLFAWAMWLPTTERIGAATIFTMLVFLPAIRADSKANEAKALQGE